MDERESGVRRGENKFERERWVRKWNEKVEREIWERKRRERGERKMRKRFALLFLDTKNIFLSVLKILLLFYLFYLFIFIMFWRENDFKGSVPCFHFSICLSDKFFWNHVASLLCKFSFTRSFFSLMFAIVVRCLNWTVTYWFQTYKFWMIFGLIGIFSYL